MGFPVGPARPGQARAGRPWLLPQAVPDPFVVWPPGCRSPACGLSSGLSLLICTVGPGEHSGAVGRYLGSAPAGPRATSGRRGRRAWEDGEGSGLAVFSDTPPSSGLPRVLECP